MDVVAGRHDADDARRRTVDRNGAPDDRLVAAERRTPDLVREDRDVFGARQRVFARELPAADRRDTPSAGISSEVTTAELTRRGWSGGAKVDARQRDRRRPAANDRLFSANSMNSGADTQN